MLRYTADGDLIGARTWGGPEHDGALGIAHRGGDIYIAGKTASFGEGQDEAILLHVVGPDGRFPEMGPGGAPEG
ncbi:MAG: hypothetical protein M1325_05440 [Actinobacteria bacterium]|nr:hypothetical protein [Actinomycetota bacterium]